MTNEEAIKILKCCIIDKCEDCPLKAENAYACPESSVAPTFVEVPKDELLQVLELLKERQWISVNDRLPEADQYVLTIDKLGFYYIDCVLNTGEWEENTSRINPVTHWIPLPEPPKEGDGE